MIKNRHLIDPMDFTTEEIGDILTLSEKISKRPENYSTICSGKILASLFYEPSTRTRLSFEAAMMRLGGQVIGFSEASSSSVSKGESIADTIRTVACYADIVVMRHPKEGAPKVASLYSDISVINAGDGGHQHPTQTLTDLMTIRSVKGSLNDLKIGYCGDLKFGRTVHSLIKALSRYQNNEMHLISPKELTIPDYIKEEILDKQYIKYTEHEKIESCIDQLDILYMTRVQKERFFNEEDYIRLKDTYILDNEKMEKAQKHMIVMHPLPRVNEIAYEVDNDPRAYYFTQAKMGMYVRMGLISLLLGVC
ncbi:MAG: aspartate carbamoyltransferase [Bacteroidota bacterium]